MKDVLRFGLFHYCSSMHCKYAIIVKLYLPKETDWHSLIPLFNSQTLIKRSEFRSAYEAKIGQPVCCLLVGKDKKTKIIILQSSDSRPLRK